MACSYPGRVWGPACVQLQDWERRAFLKEGGRAADAALGVPLVRRTTLVGWQFAG